MSIEFGNQFSTCSGSHWGSQRWLAPKMPPAQKHDDQSQPVFIFLEKRKKLKYCRRKMRKACLFVLVLPRPSEERQASWDDRLDRLEAKANATFININIWGSWVLVDYQLCNRHYPLDVCYGVALKLILWCCAGYLGDICGNIWGYIWKIFWVEAYTLMFSFPITLVSMYLKRFRSWYFLESFKDHL